LFTSSPAPLQILDIHLKNWGLASKLLLYSYCLTWNTG
jgi:hypothetical protein